MKIEEIDSVVSEKEIKFDQGNEFKKKIDLEKKMESEKKVVPGKEKKDMYWSKVKAKFFPFPKGYTRLSIVAVFLVSFLRSCFCRGDEVVLFVSTFCFMVGIYVGVIWIYWGFKNGKE